jgi:penicillin-binding protein 1C
MRRWRKIFSIAACAAIAGGLACAGWIYSLGPVPLGKDLEYSHVVLDREGRLLRAYATNEGRWRLPVAEDDVDPRFLNLLFAYEDKRFREHSGVDPLALGRAAIQFASRGHIVSGGSTITMQVARLLEPRERRSLGAKLRQVVRALELERAFDKHEILGLPDACPLWREPRRHSRGLAGLFRQGAPQTVAGRGRAAGCPAAIA